jgi:hypothetical protein
MEVIPYPEAALWDACALSYCGGRNVGGGGRDGRRGVVLMVGETNNIPARTVYVLGIFQ